MIIVLSQMLPLLFLIFFFYLLLLDYLFICLFDFFNVFLTSYLFIYLLIINSNYAYQTIPKTRNVCSDMDHLIISLLISRFLLCIVLHVDP